MLVQHATRKSPFTQTVAGSPDDLLGVSDEVSVTNTSKAWMQFHFSTPVAVTANAYYWFPIMTDDNVYWATNWGGSTPHKGNSNAYGDGFSDPFGSITGADYTSHDSFYAVLSTGGGAGECPTTTVTVKYDNTNSFRRCRWTCEDT